MTFEREVCYLTAAELSEGYRRKRFTALEVTEALLRRIERLDRGLRAYITVTADHARAQAKAADAALAQSDPRPFFSGASLVQGDPRRQRDGVNYGVGLRYDVTHSLGLRVEYARFGRFAGEMIGSGMPDSDQVSIGVQYRF